MKRNGSFIIERPYFLFILFCVSFLPLMAQDWHQVIKAVASDRAEEDHFGYAVSVSDSFAIVGAYDEDEDATGSNTLSSAGSAYIFYFDGSSWTLQQKIVASDRHEGDNFGHSVSISGNYAIVGAVDDNFNAEGSEELLGAGSAYIFYYNGSVWEQQQKIVASDRGANDRFGCAVSISGDNVVIGAEWEMEDEAGANSMTNAGSAYVFHFDGTSWIQQQKIIASDRTAIADFGCDVCISGNRLIVGADQGGEDKSGSAYIFYYNDSSWIEKQKISASDCDEFDHFAGAVSISGDFAIVGAPDEGENPSGINYYSVGSAYIFHYDGSSWNQQQKIKASDWSSFDNFGNSVSISGDYALVGAHYEDNDTLGMNYLSCAGSAYIFHYDGSIWEEQQKIIPEDRAAEDIFGCSVSISGENIIIGAYFEDHNVQGTDSLETAGSVYFFSATNNISSISEDGMLAEHFSVDNAYPNPFNPSVTVNFQLPVSSRVKASVYNTKGTLVEELLNRDVNAGSHTLIWNAANMPSGIYILKMFSGDMAHTQKLILLK